jgi:16S rRNA (guanine(966)-N(2))-methyltransferase RsmD
MRVIAGKARGVHLTAPKGIEVRPTLDKVRGALFNILGPRVEAARFLDLFAGTGANGIEALSRGARICTFVDNDVRSLGAIRRNLDAARLSEFASIRRLTLPRGLSKLVEEGATYDIVFADPPYDFADYRSLLDTLRAEALLDPGAIVVIEHRAKRPLTREDLGLDCIRHAEYGATALSFFS